MPFTSDFDPVCYIQNYPDLQDRATEPARSGLPLSEQLGWMFKSSDGRWKYGRTNNRKLFRIQSDPYWHWINFGMKEGRVPGCRMECSLFSNEFDAAAYTKRYPDVSGLSYPGTYNSYINNPLGHWLEVGSKQGRIPGVEYITNDCKGIVPVGTGVYKTDAEIAEEFEEYRKRHLSAGSGEVASGSASDVEHTSSKGSSNIILLAGLGIGAYLLLKNKRNAKR